MVAASSLPTHPPVPSCAALIVSIATGEVRHRTRGNRDRQEGLCLWTALGCLQAPSVVFPSPRWCGRRSSCPASWVLCGSLRVQGLQQKRAGQSKSVPCPSSPVLRPNATSLSPGVELPTRRERRRSQGSRRWSGLGVSEGGLGVRQAWVCCPAPCCVSLGRLESLSGHELLMTAAAVLGGV